MLEVTSQHTLDSTYVAGDIKELLGELNVAAAAGKHFVMFTEIRNGDETPVLLETRNITRVRTVEVEDAFVGR